MISQMMVKAKKSKFLFQILFKVVTIWICPRPGFQNQSILMDKLEQTEKSMV